MRHRNPQPFEVKAVDVPPGFELIHWSRHEAPPISLYRCLRCGAMVWTEGDSWIIHGEMHNKVDSTFPPTFRLDSDVHAKEKQFLADRIADLKREIARLNDRSQAIIPWWREFPLRRFVVTNEPLDGGAKTVILGGIQFHDGTVAIRWAGDTPSFVVWNSIEEFKTVSLGADDRHVERVFRWMDSKGEET